MNRLLMVAAALLLPAAAFAQEPAPERKTVRVLAEPADIASFYRSGDSGTVRYNARKRVSPYALASYYRSHQDSALGYSSSRSRAYDRVVIVSPAPR